MGTYTTGPVVQHRAAYRVPTPWRNCPDAVLLPSRLRDKTLASPVWHRPPTATPDTPGRYRGIVGQDEQPDDESLAAFEALGGQLTWDELARLLGCDEQDLSRAVLGLPFRQRQAVVLCKQTGLSEKQAAKEMGISTGAVRAHLARGLQTLRYPPG
jgi:hypothetical protein